MHHSPKAMLGRASACLSKSYPLSVLECTTAWTLASSDLNEMCKFRVHLSESFGLELEITTTRNAMQL